MSMTFATANGDILADEGFYLALTMGLCLGSLATALAYRLPRSISMITQERSQCPSCGRTLGFFDLIPIASWLFLRGRCRGCKKFYGLRYLGIECATLALCLSFYFLLPVGVPVLAIYFTAPILIALMAIDFEWQLLPDKLNAALAGTAVLAIVLITGLLPLDGQAAAWSDAGLLLLWTLGGAVLYAGFFLLLRLIMTRLLQRDPLGLGDVKFLAAAGLWLGPDPMRFALFIFICGAVGTLMGLGWRRMTGQAEFPFGPALIAAFAGFLLAGEALLLGNTGEYVKCILTVC